MRHSTLAIAGALLLIGGSVGTWFCSQQNPGDFFVPSQQAHAAQPDDSAPLPADPFEIPSAPQPITLASGNVPQPLPKRGEENRQNGGNEALILGQNPTKTPNQLRPAAVQQIPANPLRSDDETPQPINHQAAASGNVQLAGGTSPSPFDFPAPPSPNSSPIQGFGDLPSTPSSAPAKTAQPAAPQDDFGFPPIAPPKPLPTKNPTVPAPQPTENLLTPRNSSIESTPEHSVRGPNGSTTPVNADPFADALSAAVPPTTAKPQPEPLQLDLPAMSPVPPPRQNGSPTYGRSVENPPVASNAAARKAPLQTSTDSIEGTGTPGPSALEGAQTPHITIEKILPAEIVVDQPTTIKTILKNSGRSAAKDIVLRDRVPQGTRLVSTSPEGSMTASGEIVWTLGNLTGGEQVAIEMRVIPFREGEIGSVASVGYTAEASARITVTRPMLHVDVKAPSEVQLGQVANLEITISNPGSATATGVVLEEHVPDGLYHKDGKVLVNKNVDTLKPKESKRLTLPLTCTGSGSLVNHLIVKANGNLSVEEKTMIRAVSPMLNLEVVGPKQRFLERKAGYRLVVSNPGSAAAKNVDLVVYLPTALQFVSTNQSGVYEKSTHTVHWALEELPAEESGEIELVVLPLKAGEHSIRFSGNGESGLKKEVTQSLTVDGLAALSFEVACLSNLIEVGRDTVYEIRVSNRGTKASSNVTVTANLSEGMNFVNAEGPVRFQANGGIVTFESLPQLESKGEKVYRVTAKCVSDGDHRISVKVQSDELRAPITKEESTRVFQ